MAYVRDNTAYSLTTIPVNGTMNATHINEANKWANSAHQRGICHQLTCTRGRDKLIPALGYSNLVGQIIGPKLSIAMPLSIPDGYDRYAVHTTYRLPRIMANIPGFPIDSKAYISLGFSNGSGVFYPIFEDLTGVGPSDQSIVFTGNVPVLGQVGAIQRLWLLASLEILPDDGVSTVQGTQFSWTIVDQPAYVGFSNIVCHIYKENEC